MVHDPQHSQFQLFLLKDLLNLYLLKTEGSFVKREVWVAASFQLWCFAPGLSSGRDEQILLLSLEGTNPACSGMTIQQEMPEKQRGKRQVHTVCVSGSSGRVINSL